MIGKMNYWTDEEGGGRGTEQQKQEHVLPFAEGVFNSERVARRQNPEQVLARAYLYKRRYNHRGNRLIQIVFARSGSVGNICPGRKSARFDQTLRSTKWRMDIFTSSK